MPDLRYAEFATNIDLERFYEAIEWEPLRQDNRGNDIGHCPDPWAMHKHGDTSGKFAIHRDKRVFNCWVCGGGSLLSLAMAIKDMSDEEAKYWLYQFATESEQDDDDFLIEVASILSTIKRETKVWPYFSPHVLERYEGDPWKWPDSAWQFLAAKSVSALTACGFNVRYGVVTKLPPMGLRDSEEAHTGEALILPHSWDGRLVGWQTRWLSDDRPKWCPKYVNTSDFPRTETVYGYEVYKNRPEPIIVCESVMTVLALGDHGIPAVATFGATVTEEQMRALRRFQQGVIIAPDNDGPGEKFARELRAYLDRYIPVFELPPVTTRPGADLGDIAGMESALLEHLDLWF